MNLLLLRVPPLPWHGLAQFPRCGSRAFSTRPSGNPASGERGYLHTVLRIRDPDFYPTRIPNLGSRILDPKTSTKISCHAFFCSHKFHKIEYYLIFEMLKKKIWANFQRIIELFYPKNSQKYGLGIRDPRKTYSRSQIQGSTKHRIPDPGSATLPIV
jgi:hypothetical protein